MIFVAFPSRSDDVEGQRWRFGVGAWVFSEEAVEGSTPRPASPSCCAGEAVGSCHHLHQRYNKIIYT